MKKAALIILMTFVLGTFVSALAMRPIGDSGCPEYCGCALKNDSGKDLRSWSCGCVGGTVQGDATCKY